MHRNIPRYIVWPICIANQITNIAYLYLTIWLTYTILTLWLTESKTWQRNPILVGYRIIRQFADFEQFRTIHHKSCTLLILQHEYSWILNCNCIIFWLAIESSLPNWANLFIKAIINLRSFGPGIRDVNWEANLRPRYFKKVNIAPVITTISIICDNLKC